MSQDEPKQDNLNPEPEKVSGEADATASREEAVIPASGDGDGVRATDFTVTESIVHEYESPSTTTSRGKKSLTSIKPHTGYKISEIKVTSTNGRDCDLTTVIKDKILQDLGRNVRLSEIRIIFKDE